MSDMYSEAVLDRIFAGLFDDLPGVQVVAMRGGLYRDVVALGVYQNLGMVEYGNVIYLSRKTIDRMTPAELRRTVEVGFHPTLYPWLHPMRNPMPFIVLFPRLERLCRRIRRRS